MNARELLGSKVRDRNGRALGEVEEIIVDRLTGRLSFAVVRLRHGSGSGAELLPVPWSALAAGSGGHELRLGVGARRIAEAPKIDRTELDDLERRDVGVDVFSFYGVQPPWDGSRRA